MVRRGWSPWPRRLAECRLCARGRRGEVDPAVDHLDLRARDEVGAGVRCPGTPVSGHRVAVDLKALDRSTAEGGNGDLDVAQGLVHLRQHVVVVRALVCPGRPGGCAVTRFLPYIAVRATQRDGLPGPGVAGEPGRAIRRQ